MTWNDLISKSEYLQIIYINVPCESLNWFGLCLRNTCWHVSLFSLIIRSYMYKKQEKINADVHSTIRKLLLINTLYAAQFSKS